MHVKSEIYTRLTATFTPTQLDVVDESHLHAGHREAGDAIESHFRVTIQSNALEGLSKVKQHQAIYRAIGELMNNPIHALAIQVIPTDIAS